MNPFRHFAAALILCAALFAMQAANAAPTHKGDAKKVVKGWFKETPRPLKTKLSHEVLEVMEIKSDEGETIAFAVNLKPSGYVVVSADDLIEPIIAFSATGRYDAIPGNPMHAMVQNDLPKRLKQVKKLQAEAKKAGKNFTPAKAHEKSKSKWKELTDNSELLLGGDATGVEVVAEAESAPPASIDEVRVNILCEARWAQGNYNGLCFNYYTPNNYLAGCVATGMAQIMSHHEYPTAGIGVQSCGPSVDGVYTPMNTRGGDGAGGPYDWANMVADPANITNDTQRQAIGALIYDAGITVNMSYTASLSLTGLRMARFAFVGEFQYGNAIYKSYPSTSEFNGMVNAGLEAGYPSLLGVDGAFGHAVVCDGYGYNTGTMYHHINMGWSGSSDGWYNLPDMDMFNTVSAVVYNIFPTGVGQIISGKLISPLGTPLSGITVTATNGGNQYTDVSDDEGNYGIRVPSETAFVVTCPGAAPKNLTTGLAVESGADSGNHWGQDFVCDNGPQLFYADGPFVESTANDGSITNSLIVSLYDDTFTGSNGADVSSNVVVTNLSPGLSAQFIKDSNTQLTVSLTGNATSHGLANDISDLTFTFQNAAFGSGDASSVADYIKTDLAIDFHDTTESLPYAVDAPSLSWSFSDHADWFYQTGTTHDGVDAGQGGSITHNQKTSMQTTVVGPGTMTFWWKVDCETNYDRLRVYINGSENSNITGRTEWAQKTLTIPAGSTTVKWSYTKDGSRSSYSDTGWVDQVVYTPDFTTYSVTYDGGGNNGGSVPVDSNSYDENDAVTVLGNTGSLVKTGYTFTGWNTAANGGGTPYSAGGTFNITQNTTLYAQWTALPTYTLTVTNGTGDGSYPDGFDVAITAAAPQSGYRFNGWSTSDGGSFANADAASTTYTMPANAAEVTASYALNNLPSVDAGLAQTVALSGESVEWTPAPANISTVAWFDAADGDTITEGEEGVSQWADKSGNGNHAYQETGTSQPAYDGINNKLTFDGGDLFKVTNDPFKGLQNFAVVSIQTWTTNAGWQNASASFHGESNNGWQVRQRDSGSLTFTVRGTAGTDDPTSATTNNLEFIGSCLRKNSSDRIIRQNGTQTYSDTGDTGSISYTGTNRSCIGGRYHGDNWTSPNGHLRGELKEVIVIENATDEDVQKAEGYLAWKWGREGDLPTGHPYKDAAPLASAQIATAILDGAISDTDGDSLTSTWSVVGDDTGVSIANPNALNTTVSFTQEGDYTLRLTVNDGYGSNTDDVVITVGTTPYDSWMSGSFANAFTDTASSSDPDGDGRSNFVEFAFGMDPTSCVSGPMVYSAGGDITSAGMPILTNPGSSYEAVFPRRKDFAAAGLTYTVEFSCDLGLWTSSAAGLSVVTGASSSGDYEAVSVPFPPAVPLQAGGSDAPKFFRVSVTMD